MEDYERGFRDGIAIGETRVRESVVRKLIIWGFNESLDLIAKDEEFVPIIEQTSKRLKKLMEKKL